MDPLLPQDDLLPEARARCFTWPMLQYTQYAASYDGIPTTVGGEPTVAQLLAATPSSSSAMIHPDTGLVAVGGVTASGKKKRCRRKPADQLAQKKPNPWGEESYSDLIAKALENAIDGRLKLNEIYQWFSDNVAYFRERSSQEEAAGWKVRAGHDAGLEKIRLS